MSKDLFSKQSDIYARYRPDYPSGLIDYILQFVSQHNKVWDCATGNGQAAIMLASHFQLVQATDISEKQLLNATPHPRIHYSIEAAENTTFPDNSFDLVTVAQAYHWFNFTAFHEEVKRVVKPNGIIAIWGYGLVTSEIDQLNTKIETFYSITVGPYWDPERKFIDDHYRTIPFPYVELPPKEFFIEKRWSLDDLTGFLNSWSSVQHFIKANAYNPVDRLKKDLQMEWPADDFITLRFPLFLRLGRILG